MKAWMSEWMDGCTMLGAKGMCGGMGWDGMQSHMHEWRRLEDLPYEFQAGNLHVEVERDVEVVDVDIGIFERVGGLVSAM
jgi:hypothetical protein